MRTLTSDNEQFVTDSKGQRTAVLVDLKTYERLREAEEELSDIRAYDAAQPKVEAELKAGRRSTLQEYRTKRLKAK